MQRGLFVSVGEFLNVAISVCSNDIFVFSGLLLNQVSHKLQISIYPINRLNELLTSGNYNFIKASSAALVKCKNYQAVGVGASLARIKGPQLVQRQDRVLGNTLGVPSLNSTGALLAKKYYPHLEQIAYPLNTLSKMLMRGKLAYAVIINEDMNRLDELGLESICDLGLRWNEENKAVLPLGLFAAHTGLSSMDITAFERAVNESVLWARSHEQKALELSQSYAGDAQINAKHIQLFTKDAHYNPVISSYVEKLIRSLNIRNHVESF